MQSYGYIAATLTVVFIARVCPGLSALLAARERWLRADDAMSEIEVKIQVACTLKLRC